MFWFWLFVAPAVTLALLSLRGEHNRAEYVAACLNRHHNSPLPPATVIVPVKGPEEGLRENLASLASQDYPNYELIVVAQSAADIPPGVLPARAKIVVSCQGPSHMGEKIQNLRAAVRAARKRSEIFAFADSDGRAGTAWLRALVAPLAEPGVGASTGYRWYLPERPTFWPLIRSIWNAAIAGTFGPGSNAFAWGGAMAVRKEVFFELRVPEFWKNSVSDDYALSAAVRKAGLRIAYAPGAMVAATDHIRAGDFLGWAQRQMIITRIYRPKLWWQAFLAHMFYCGGMVAAAAAAALGHWTALIALFLQLAPGMWKGYNRANLAKAELPDGAGWFKSHGWVHTWWVPLVTWVWLVSLLSSAFTSKIEWRGNRYVLSPSEIRKM